MSYAQNRKVLSELFYIFMRSHYVLFCFGFLIVYTFAWLAPPTPCLTLRFQVLTLTFYTSFCLVKSLLYQLVSPFHQALPIHWLQNMTFLDVVLMNRAFYVLILNKTF